MDLWALCNPLLIDYDFTFSHAQGLAALQAYCHWMAQYYLETHRQQQHQEKFVTLISKAVDALIPLLNKDVSRVLIDWAWVLLYQCVPLNGR